MAGRAVVEGEDGTGRNCDLCSEACDSETQELNALSCTFAPNCPEDASVYHQDCLERYLKNIRCEKNRKTGFKCPRGCGKTSRFDEPCRGKIDKSHPIHPRNDNNKKRKKAKMPEPVEAPVPRFGPAAKAARAKEREEEKAKQKQQAKAAAKAVPAAAPKATTAVSKKESLASAAAAARRELGLSTGGASANGSVKAAARPAAAMPAGRSYDEHLAARSSRQDAPAPQVSAGVKGVWGGGATSAVRPAAPSPLPLSSPEAFPAVSAASRVVQQLNGTWAAGNELPPASAATSRPLSAGTGPGARMGISAASGSASTASQEEVPKLSKALRKNMRRAERKREKEAETSVTSEPSPPVTPHQTAGLAKAPSQGSPAASPGRVRQQAVGPTAQVHLQQSPNRPAAPTATNVQQPLPQLSLDGDTMEHCLQLVAMHKMQQTSLQLQQLGFEEWQAVTAVHLCGCSLHPAVQWLLEGRVASLLEAQQLLLRTPLPSVDVTDEAAQLTAAAAALEVPQATVCQLVAQVQGDVTAALAALAGSNGGATPTSARQRHQRTFSPLSSTAPTPAQLQPLPPPAPPQRSRQRSAGSDALDPLLDAVLPREKPCHIVFGAHNGPRTGGKPSMLLLQMAPIAQQRAAVAAAPGQQRAPSGAPAAPPGFAAPQLPSGAASTAASDMHSRVSSFDMLSVGNPWGDLLPSSSEPSHEQSQLGQHAKMFGGGEGRNGFGSSSAFQQLQTPFGGHHHHHSSSFFGSPASFTGGTSNPPAINSALGLDHYASALSSQPSWASTSSNMWGMANAPQSGEAHSFGGGIAPAQQQQPQQQPQQRSDVPADFELQALVAALLDVDVR